MAERSVAVEVDVAPQDVLQEKCGILAIYDPHARVTPEKAMQIGSGIKHRGYHGWGLARFSSSNTLGVWHGDQSFVDEGIIDAEVVNRFGQMLEIPAKLIIAQTRYGTNGGWGRDNLQPCRIQNPNGGEFAVIHNGEFQITDRIRNGLLHGQFASDESDTRMFTRVLAQTSGGSVEEKVGRALNDVNGTYNLAVGANENGRTTLVVARDIMGNRPCVIGKMGDSWIVTSESIGLQKAGADLIGEVDRGSIIRINEDGLRVIKKGESGRLASCTMEPPYFMRSDSLYPIYDKQGNLLEWIPLQIIRENIGSVLADRFPVPHATLDIGMPKSGLDYATGFARRHGREPVELIGRRNPTRTFMGDNNQEGIVRANLEKLVFFEDPRWRDSIAVLNDDSMVRGNVSKTATEVIRSLGAKEVHWRIAHPQLVYPCHLGTSTRTFEELISFRNKGNTEAIAKEIGADSVEFTPRSGYIGVFMNGATTYQEAGMCGGCDSGEFPIYKDGSLNPKFISELVMV